MSSEGLSRGRQMGVKKESSRCGLRSTHPSADQSRLLGAEQERCQFRAILHLSFDGGALVAARASQFPDRVFDIAAQMIGTVLERRALLGGEGTGGGEYPGTRDQLRITQGELTFFGKRRPGKIA